MSTIEASARPDSSSLSESVEAEGARRSRLRSRSRSRPSRTVAKTPACTAFGWKSSASVIGRASPAGRAATAARQEEGRDQEGFATPTAHRLRMFPNLEV